MKIQTYDNIRISLIQATPNPASTVYLARLLTMAKKIPEDICLSAFGRVTTQDCGYLIDAEHASLFEHVVYTFLITGMSRSLLAQITRQRTASPTSGSQHYQDYSEYPVSISPEYIDEPEIAEQFRDAFDQSLASYEKLLELGVPREEARQVLPNAATVNYLWTIDARNLLYFLRMRMCNRNVLEMRKFAWYIFKLVHNHFSELFTNVGPQCVMGMCAQGKLRCKEKAWRAPV
jgi:thymidylate synthase (FAD)